MAPSKKSRRRSSAKGAAEAAAPSAFDGLDMAVLEEKAKELTAQLEEVVQSRSYVQLERDTLERFREMTLNEVKHLENISLVKDQQISEAMENHRVELQVYEHKVKHLKYESQLDAEQAKAKAGYTQKEDTLRSQAKIHQSKEDRAELDAQRADAESEFHVRIASLKGSLDQEFVEIQKRYANMAESYATTCKERLRKLREDRELQCRVELEEVQDRKNGHIHALQDRHEAAFREMKDYYQEITSDNCRLIEQYQSDIARLKQNKVKNAALMRAALQENARLSEPLSAALAQVAELQGKLSEKDKTHLMLVHARARLHQRSRQAEAGEGKVRVLRDKFKAAEARTEELYKLFEVSIVDVQSANDRRNAMLRRRLDSAAERVDDYTAKMEQACKAMVLDPEAVHAVREETSKEFLSLVRDAHEARTSVAYAAKVYNESLVACKEKMKDMGVPPQEVDELGFVPVDVGCELAKGPSGLVASPI